MDLLQDASVVTISVDLWSNKRSRGYLRVTAHFVGESGTLRNVLLACKRSIGSNTADQIFQRVMGTLTEFPVKEKVFLLARTTGVM